MDSVSVDPTSVTLLVGETTTLTATVLPARADNKTVAWSSDNPTVDGNKTASCLVNVIAPTDPEDILTMIPDPAFRAYLADIVRMYDSDRNGKLSAAEASGVTTMSIWENRDIVTLAGINHFTGLTELLCRGCPNLISLDVSGLTSLTYLACNGNKLTSLDVSGLTELTQLYCEENQLTSLDVSGLTKLEWLNCYYNQLTSLDVSDSTTLKGISCFRNQLSSLDVSGFTALESLNCGYNQLTSLDVSGCTALTELSCSTNLLSSLDISDCTRLTSIYYYFNPGADGTFLVKAWFDWNPATGTASLPAQFTMTPGQSWSSPYGGLVYAQFVNARR